MHIVDFYPSKGSFALGDIVTFFIELELSRPQNCTLQILIQHLNEQPDLIQENFQLQAGEQLLQMQWMPPSKPAGYSARLVIFRANDTDSLDAATAFDVLSNWTEFPRYGFLTDFSASRSDPESVIKKLTRYHINGLQFYDWQYRHDKLLAPTDDYIDPLGREMSLVAVRKLVDAAHAHGIAAMPYLAIYAASADFWRAHPDWALYNEAGQPIAFGENFLGLMDPSTGSRWSGHLLAEGARALQAIPFDGLHIDQYGDPKQAWNSRHSSVHLPQAFVDFIQSASDQHPEKTVLFNAVGNWPIKALTQSAVDFTYIEIWPPDVEYRRLAEIVLNAVRLSLGKAMVIALYLPANRPANNLLADAVILACGGTRIELGEDARLLTNPYFPKHEEISAEMSESLRRLADFAVRNGEWIRPYTLSQPEKEVWANAELNPSFIVANKSILTVVRRHATSLIVQLVNLHGLHPHVRWDEAHSAPSPCEKIPIRIRLAQRPSQVLWDCPERIHAPQALRFEYSDGMLTFQIPHIDYIGLVAIHE